MHRPASVSFQTLCGVWSPADNAYTVIVRDEFNSYKEAKASLKGVDDPTLAIIEVRTKLVWRATDPPYAPPAWATADAG